METILNNPEDGTQTNTQNPEDNGQAGGNFIPEEQHKNLQSEYTKRVESEIWFATELVQANPEKLKSIQDPRVQNAVAKRLYNVDTYAQLVAVYGENFYKTSDEENLDRTEKLEMEIRMLKFKSETESLEAAINEHVRENKSIYSNPSEIEKLRNELKYISSELPPSERVQRASRIINGNINPEANWYKHVAVWNPTNGGNSTQTTDVAQSERQKQIDEWFRLLNLKVSNS